MNTRQTTVTNERTQRGSVLILVVAVLLLMVLLGTAFIQAARLDRLATSQMGDAAITQIEAGELSRIKYFLKLDLVDPDTGKFLDDGEYSVSNGGGTFKHDREPYDYGHKNVDPWLASNTPLSNKRWNNMSDLTEGDPGINIFDASFSYEVVQKYDSSTAIDASSSTQFDADGDGIGDSFFIKCAIPQVGGKVYVAAIRIIDLAGMLNINTATAAKKNNNAYTSVLEEAPRWRYPSELDIVQWLKNAPGSNKNTAISDTLGIKFNSAGFDPPVPWFAADPNAVVHDARSMTGYWREGARLYGDPNTPYRKLGIATELVLRRRNGLNSTDYLASPLQIQSDAMRGMMRDDLDSYTKEHDYTDIAGISSNDINKFFNVDGYGEMRKGLTTMSATAEFAPDVDGSSTSARVKLDLNTATAAEISARVLEVYSKDPPTTWPKNLADQQEFADQLAANIKDYADADNILTNQGSQWGCEALPAVTEAMIHHAYQITHGADANNPDPRWEHKGSGFVIEVRNPFNQPISLENITIKVGAAQAALTDCGLTELPKGEFIAVWGLQGEMGDAGTLPDLTLGAEVPAATLDMGTSTFFGGADQQCFMVVKDDKGADISYQRVKILNVEDHTGPENATGLDPNTFTDRKWGYLQRGTIGNGNGLNALITNNADYTNNVGTYGATDTPTLYDPDLDGIGIADKRTAPGGPANVINPAESQLIFRNSEDDELWQVGELAHIGIFGPNASKTFLWDRWGGSTNVTDFQIDMDTTEVAGTGAFNLPHWMLLMDQFTTYGPQTDGLDNDGDGDTDEADELVVPGRLNVNTAPASILERALPLPMSTADRGALADKILEYRFDPATRTTYRTSNANDRGIASLGELWLVPTMQTALVDKGGYATAGSVDMRIDFLPEPVTLLDAEDDDGVVDDREEKARLMRWLGQVCTVRSDVFAAYVVVRGYSSGNFSDAESGEPRAPAEQSRFVAIIDRSGVLTKDDSPRVLAILKF